MLSAAVRGAKRASLRSRSTPIGGRLQEVPLRGQVFPLQQPGATRTAPRTSTMALEQLSPLRQRRSRTSPAESTPARRTQDGSSTRRARDPPPSKLTPRGPCPPFRTKRERVGHPRFDIVPRQEGCATRRHEPAHGAGVVPRPEIIQAGFCIAFFAVELVAQTRMMK